MGRSAGAKCIVSATASEWYCPIKSTYSVVVANACFLVLRGQDELEFIDGCRRTGQHAGKFSQILTGLCRRHITPS